MAGTKRIRLNTWSPSQPPTPIGDCRLKRESMFELPADIGRISAIATWSPKSSDPSISVGTEAGAVILVTNTGSSTVLETTGPAVLCLMMKHASWSNPHVPDIVSGDCEGRVTVFSMNQVFSRSILSAPISAIAPNSNPNSANSLVVGDLNGVVTACHAQETLWRTQIRPHVSSAMIPSTSTLLNDPMITAVCSSQFPDKHGVLTSYVLAATGTSQISILARGTPMCTGSFIQPSTASGSQVMAGDESGRLFVLDNFELIPYISVPHPITRILAIPLSAFSDKPGPDVIIVHTLELGFWPVARTGLEDDASAPVGALHIYSLNALDSPEPSVVALPNIMYVDEPTVISQSTSTPSRDPVSKK
ncbi:hypothetical protein DL89DRAFT_294308 [Linderina pennispora]|uniref:Uncharacterized protein n=1 Tax=Linderina pennispora TaxID=61395 RepID=A0A1Y1W3K4_9FUNG|nr:uncharacterized protein DL89DRAFT_294308 [Linderina pennispora]ORX67734.1 hypothetical protein DL89DRAFT_294308 [Linderina pennispora]